ncbi:uncharacterized protein LOC124795620 [Schistocerca piceifrons]|uniref:uncharacterized protein LOC124795620 n=1 Tax=Schistocerca piceifrons TaxID=274613 RepID=UPI001F5FB2F6|nr:uncharacterized protein LOC124795620 [Schistocerca piceifrons]
MAASQSRLPAAVALLLLMAAATPAHARRFGRCELARELRYRHGLPWDQLATWVCIANYESNFDTAAVGRLNGDGSLDHGIFQISDKYWCSPPGHGWACGISCDRLQDDDISDDVTCARRIHAEHQRLSGDGFNAWTVYRQHCSGGRAGHFLNGWARDSAEPSAGGLCPFWRRRGVPIAGSRPRLPPPPLPRRLARLPTAPPPAAAARWARRRAHHTSLPASSDAMRRPPQTLTLPALISTALAAGAWLALARAKTFERCELAQELRYRHGLPAAQVPTWVCIARFESLFNTSAVGRLSGGSLDHGLFQMSDAYWCSPPGRGTACGLSCDKLVDNDISDDVECALRVYREHQRLSGDGFNAWVVYQRFCSRGRADHYVDDCFEKPVNANVV